MRNQRIKHRSIKAKDFSHRNYFPGTLDHPFHTITAIQDTVAKVPAPIFSLLIGGIIYLISRNIEKSLLIAVFSLMDWVLLSLLPVFHISYGPPNLTALVLGLMRLPFLLLPLPAAVCIQCLGTLLLLVGFYIEPQYPKVSRYHLSLSVKNHPSQIVKIVHLSDLHMEYLTQRETRVIEIINQIAPDLVLFTGDFFNLSFQHDARTHKAIIHFFDQIQSKYGVFGVTGSPAVDLEESIAAIQPKMKLKLINDTCQVVDLNNLKLELVGLSCTHQPGKDADRLKKLLRPDPRDARVLLYHSPDIAPAIENLPIELQVSGHTHGGQVQLPFIGPIYTGSLYGLQFSNGLYQINRSPYLILSRGLGLEGDAAPRVRFLSPPEIGLITLEFTQDIVQ